MGSAYQWTSDVTERCHITHAKTPYHHSNHHDFHKQCCQFLDRDEKRRFFHLYILLKDNQVSLLNEMQREASAMHHIIQRQHGLHVFVLMISLLEVQGCQQISLQRGPGFTLE
jgi:hypothetical protein